MRYTTFLILLGALLVPAAAQAYETKSLNKLLDQDKCGQCNLAGAILDGKDLSAAKLPGANLFAADLENANLTKADLDGSNLMGADLEGANLSGADLHGAKLSGAILTDANLTGANLRQALVGQAIFQGARLCHTVMADGTTRNNGCP